MQKISPSFIQDGKIAATRVGRFLVCMYVEEEVEIGLIKAKVGALCALVCWGGGVIFLFAKRKKIISKF